MEKYTRKTNVLLLKNIAKTFEAGQGKRIPVLQKIDLELELTSEQRKFVVFLGPSGCGKTTLLRIIAGLEEPSGGDITYQGHRPEKGWATVVFQEFSLFPWYTVQENVEFGLRMQGISKAERERMALAYLKEVDLERFAFSYPYELSGGMKQRVALARSLAVKTPLLLMDEPFGSLDMLTREKMYNFMWDIWQQSNVSVILVTHNIEEAVLLGDTIHILSAAPARIVETITSQFTPSDREGRNRALEEMVRELRIKILSYAEPNEVIKNAL